MVKEIKQDNFIKVNCPICDMNDCHFVLSGRDKLINIKGVFDLVECNRCNLMYLNPQPTMKLLYKHYSHDYPGSSNRNLKQIVFRKSFKDNILYRLFLLSKKGVIDSINRSHILSTHTRLLDIGSGNGGFLYALNEVKGVRGIGVEIDKTAVEFSKNTLNLNIQLNTFKNFDYAGKKFDVVTMFEYFEHELDPNYTLKKVKKLLKENGLLVIELPNIESFLFKIFGKNWVNLDLPRHVFHYSPITITKILKKNGYEIIKIEQYPVVSLVTSLTHFLNLNKYVEKVTNLPILFSILLFHLPVKIVESFFGYIFKVLGSSDIMAVYAKPKIN